MNITLSARLFFSVIIFSAVYITPVSADENAPLLPAKYTFDKQAITRGGTFFAENCLTCHSMKYIRYNRLAEDLDLDKNFIKNNFMKPSGADYLHGMTTTMPDKLANDWLGVTPPDLTLVARYRGVDWINTYLRSFYWDTDTPTGWNNHTFPGVAMPNVLFSYSGTLDVNGNVLKKASHTPQEYDQTIADLVAWMRYTSDPSIIIRRHIAPYAIGYLLIFTILAYLLKRAYWRDVH